MENIDEKDDSESLEGVPSFIKSWKQIYWFVIIELVVLIGVFYYFTKSFE